MKYIASFIIIIFMFTGCATIFKGSSRDIDMNSSPDGAEIWIDNVKVGVTPCKVSIKSKNETVIEFRKDGFATKTYKLENHVGAGWIILDVLSGLVPVVIDAATGNWYEFDESNVNMMLEKSQNN